MINFPNKFLGQVFLKSRKITEEIVRAADIKSSDIILEVGPGKGILTEELVKKAKKVVAVEKDKRMVDYLKEKFSNQKNLEIIHDDILKFSIFNFQFSKYKIVANIPYYITSRFLRKFLESDKQPSLMVLMVQKEVAERIVARDKKESILSISVKVYGQSKIIKKVPAKYFSPRPKVDSAVLLIDNISKDFFSAKGGSASGGRNIDEKKFFEMVKKGFSHKRKLLKSNLMLDTECLTKCGVLEKARAEDLSPENWKCLYKNLYNLI